MVGSCKAGEIERTGYSYTKKNTHNLVIVDPICIKDKGKPGKGKKLITMPEQDVGLLSKYGYSLKNGYEKRVESLKKAMVDNNELKILKHVNALRTLQKSNDKLYNKLDKDMKWLQKDYENKKGGTTDSDKNKTPPPWSLVNFDKPYERKTSNIVSFKNSFNDNDNTKPNTKTPSPWSLVNFKNEKKSSKTSTKKSKKPTV